MRASRKVPPSHPDFGYTKSTGNKHVYNSWIAMKTRCTNLNTKTAKHYVGRGITICERWKYSFANFSKDMGPSWQKGLTLDRINNNGNYEPTNCRWATHSLQQQNRNPIASHKRGPYKKTLGRPPKEKRVRPPDFFQKIGKLGGKARKASGTDYSALAKLSHANRTEYNGGRPKGSKNKKKAKKKEK